MTARRNNLPRRTRAAKNAPGQAIREHVARFVRCRPKTCATAAVGAVAVVGAVIVLAQPQQQSRYEPPVRARQYSAYTACLLTDSDGVSGSAARSVWSAMQSASAATSAQVTYLAIQGPDTESNAETFVNTLALRHCDLVLAAGELPGQAVQHRAAAYPKQSFYVVDYAYSGALPTNVSASKAAGVASAIESAYQAWRQKG